MKSDTALIMIIPALLVLVVGSAGILAWRSLSFSSGRAWQEMPAPPAMEWRDIQRRSAMEGGSATPRAQETLADPVTEVVVQQAP